MEEGRERGRWVKEGRKVKEGEGRWSERGRKESGERWRKEEN